MKAPSIPFALFASLLIGQAALHGAPEVSFGGPDVLKIDWATRALTVKDINADGLNDLALINQDTAQIELLYQRAADGVKVDAKKRISRNRWNPEFEDASFDRDGIAVGFPVFDLAVGDLNGDGLVDLAHTAREVPLTIRYQSEAGQWAELVEFDNFEALGWTGTLKIEDLDGDGRAELVVIAADALRVFEHDEAGEFDEPRVFYLTGENPYNLLLEDINEDGLTDVLYITANGKQSLAYREQLSEGGFGPERRFIFERPVRVVQPMPRVKGESAQFCSVDSRSGSLEFFSLSYEPADASTSAFALQPEIYPIFKKGRNPATYAMGDVDGDGDADMIVANPAEAELVLFLKDAGGFAAPKRFPSFSSISSMVSGRFFDKENSRVIMLSAEEKSIGLTHLGKTGRLLFPRALELGEGDPVVCEVIDIDGDGFDELALVLEQKGKYQLTVVRPTDRATADSEWESLSVFELDAVKRKPSALKVVDVFGAERSGLMVFVPREAPLFLVADHATPDTLREAAGESPIRQNLLKDLDPTQVSIFDVTGDGKNELIVGRKGYARALHVVGDRLEMVDQFNARQGEDVISAVIPLYAGGRVERLMFYVEESGDLQSLRRDGDGVFRYQDSHEVGQMKLLGWDAGASTDSRDIIFLGDSQFWFLPTDANSLWTRQVEGSYETELEDVHYTHVESADFNADGLLELVAVDGQRHVVELLTRSEDTWESQMYWEIFERNMHYQGRTGAKLEPRQTVIADLTGDGFLDFAFLIHDRILFYPQE